MLFQTLWLFFPSSFVEFSLFSPHIMKMNEHWKPFFKPYKWLFLKHIVLNESVNLNQLISSLLWWRGHWAGQPVQWYNPTIHSRGSCHNWLNFYSSEQEATANIIFVFPFAETAKEKNLWKSFHDFSNYGKNIERLCWPEERCQISRHSLSCCLRNTIAAALIHFFFVIYWQGNITQYIVL